MKTETSKFHLAVIVYKYTVPTTVCTIQTEARNVNQAVIVYKYLLLFVQSGQKVVNSISQLLYTNSYYNLYNADKNYPL